MASIAGPASVIACVVVQAGRMCLLRRSAAVGSDRGKSHCLTGYLPGWIDALDQAVQETDAEIGLARTHLRLLDRAHPLRLHGGGCRWTVFPSLFEASTQRIQLKWEHEDNRWVADGERQRHDSVPWLRDVCRAVLPRTVLLRDKLELTAEACTV